MQFGNNKGILIVEILIIISIVATALVTFLGIAALSLKISGSIKETTQACAFSQELIEVARSFRDGTVWAANGLGVLNTGSSYPYYPQLDFTSNPPKWIMSSGVETINGFDRKIIIDKVSRDLSTKNIESVYNSSRDDVNTRKITATVSWKGKEVEIITYLTNWK
jgi:hypothetical protein